MTQPLDRRAITVKIDIELSDKNKSKNYNLQIA